VAYSDDDEDEDEDEDEVEVEDGDGAECDEENEEEGMSFGEEASLVFVLSRHYCETEMYNIWL